MKKFALALAVLSVFASCSKQEAKAPEAADADAIALPGDATPATLSEDVSPAADSTATVD